MPRMRDYFSFYWNRKFAAIHFGNCQTIGAKIYHFEFSFCKFDRPKIKTYDTAFTARHYIIGNISFGYIINDVVSLTPKGYQESKKKYDIKDNVITVRKW